MSGLPAAVLCISVSPSRYNRYNIADSSSRFVRSWKLYIYIYMLYKYKTYIYIYIYITYIYIYIYVCVCVCSVTPWVFAGMFRSANHCPVRLCPCLLAAPLLRPDGHESRRCQWPVSTNNFQAIPTGCVLSLNGTGSQDIARISVLSPSLFPRRPECSAIHRAAAASN